MNIEDKSYVVILQCDIVMERCSGYFCEKSFNEREGGCSVYPKDKKLRSIYMTCGGCCGRATHRKMSHLIRRLREKEDIHREHIVVQLASCMTLDNYHSSPCPHLDYIKGLLDKLDVDHMENTHIDKTSESLRHSGKYKS